ncbi:MAG: hypothetical protein F4Z31_22960 [Gemmatimonadetes bacterium]|nr:hypothetical protein [Gemmatimonadota bacterium]MYE92512.1 hypothetical protein [Gemmatimonadota bacterium]MYJ09639.1 hypothetical protein [Gemmatimonadota bacterium]
MTDQRPEYVVSGFSIVIMMNPNPLNPAAMSHDVLRNIGVVPSDLTPATDGIHRTSLLAQLPYEQNVVIRLTPNHAVFEQRSSETAKDIIVHDLARRFVGIINTSYIALGINPQVFRPIDGNVSIPITEMFRSNAAWLAYESHHPSGIEIKTTYNLPHRVVTITASSVQATRVDKPEEVIYGMMFQTNVHREPEGDGDSEWLHKGIDEWESDVADVLALTSLFMPQQWK